jgi:hypothetical protein
MTTVLLFAEHELDQAEVAGTLEALAGLRVTGDSPVEVTVLVPYCASRPVALMDDVAAARGSSASRAFGDARQDAAGARLSAQQTLRHVLWAVRKGGHVARGELVPVHDVVRDLVLEAAARQATAALVVTSPHRVAHLLHRDLEHRLRRAGVRHVAQVEVVRRSAATTPGDASRS